MSSQQHLVVTSSLLRHLVFGPLKKPLKNRHFTRIATCWTMFETGCDFYWTKCVLFQCGRRYFSFQVKFLAQNMFSWLLKLWRLSCPFYKKKKKKIGHAERIRVKCFTNLILSFFRVSKYKVNLRTSKSKENHYSISSKYWYKWFIISSMWVCSISELQFHFYAFFFVLKIN